MTLRRLGWVLAALASPVQAATLTESDFLAELPIVLSASRLSQPQAQAPAAVTIIDQDMIRASGFRDIPDLFRLVPGFTVAYTRENTWGVGYHGMADAFSRRMQVLIDGRSVYLPGFGNTPWPWLPVAIEDIERIEVVRGPNAAAYGANAFFGVINIITKDPSQVPGFYASAQVGEQSNSGAMLRYGGSSGDFRYRLSYSDQRRDRFDTQPEETATRVLDFRGDYRLSSSDELSVNFSASRGDWKGGRGDVQDPFEPERNYDVGAEHFQAKFRRVIDPNNEWSLQFYHIRTYLDDSYVVGNIPIPNPVPPPAFFLVDIPADLNQTQWREDLEFQMINGLGDSTRLVWGAEARWEGVDASGYFYGKDRRSGHLYRLFGNLEWAPHEQWIINGGLMAEQHYYTDFDLSPRLAVNYLATPDHAFRASISQAYRSPTFFEMDGDVRYFTSTGMFLTQRFAPADDLQPEKILSREIGYVGHVRPLNLNIDARLFYDEVRRIIGQQNVGTKTSKAFQAVNNHHADIRGADVQLRWQPHRDVDLILNYAYVHIDSDETDIEDSSPEHNLSALGIYRMPHGWEASVGVYRVGEMEWLDDGGTTEQYIRVDARLAKRWKWQGHEAELSLVGQNLSGDRYEEFRYNNLFDSRAYVGLSVDW
jgi:iron complex outermembrane receptor protein